MKNAAFHLNLLKDSERVSSSPIRLRVILPMLALLSCAGMAVWWGVIFTQLMVIRLQVQTVEDDIAAKKKGHAAVLVQQAEVREKTLQLEQLDFYKGGLRQIGEPLARLAEVMPLKVQLTELSISSLPQQNLQPAKAKVPLWGPVENCETQKLVFVGRAVKDTHINQMMESLDAPEFEGLVTKEKKINSFRQDSAKAKDGKHLYAFELEYTMPGRVFAK